MATVKIRVETQWRKVKDLPQLMRTWEERGRKFRAQFTYLATEYFLRELVSRIPAGHQFDVYRDSLETVRIPVGPRYDAFAVQANPKAKKVTKMDGRRLLFYVRRKRRARQVPPEIQVLESYGPWTLDTLPFKPNPRDAVLISRKVPYREVLRVADQLRKKRPFWSKALNELGIRAVKKNQGLVVPRGLEALPDVALDAIKLEFGLGTDKAKAHWRPALLWLQKRGLREMLKYEKDLKYALIKSEFPRWSKWPTRIKKIKAADASKFKGFQKRLGIRAQR